MLSQDGPKGIIRHLIHILLSQFVMENVIRKELRRHLEAHGYSCTLTSTKLIWVCYSVSGEK